MKEIKRIPYEVWSNSQLSIARFYWGIKIKWEDYQYDHKVLKQMLDDNDDNKKYKPDLVLYK